MADTPDNKPLDINALAARAEKLPPALSSPIRDEIATLRRETMGSNPSTSDIVSDRLTGLNNRLVTAEKAHEVENGKIKTLVQEVQERLKDKIDPIQLREELNRVREYNDPLARQLGIQTLWGQLKKEGYTVATLNGKVSVSGQKSDIAAAFTLAFNDALSEKKTDIISPIALSEIQQAIMIGTGEKFATFVGNVKNPENLTGKEYEKFLLASYEITETDPTKLIEAVQKSKMTESEKAYMLSSLRGGMNGLDVVRTVQTYTTAVDAGATVFLSEQLRSAAKLIPGAESGLPKNPAQAKEIAKQVVSDPNSLSSKPLTIVALAAAMIFGLGKGDFFTGLYRSFFVLIGWLVGCGVGKEWNVDICGKIGKGAKELFGEVGKAVKDIGGDNDDKKGKWDEKKWDGKDSEKKEEKLTVAQQALHGRLIANTDIKTKVNTFATEEKKKWSAGKIGTLEDYAKFISSAKFQEINPENLIFNANHNESVFSLSPSLSAHVSLPGNLDPMIFKRVMRTYLTTKDITTKWPKNDQELGAPEKEAFLQTNDIAADKMKDKKFQDVVNAVNEKLKPSAVASATAASAAEASRVGLVVENAPSGLTVTAKLSDDKQKTIIDFSQEIINGQEKTKQITLWSTNNAISIRHSNQDYDIKVQQGKVVFTKK